MNATLILIPLAGLGLTGTLVLSGTQGEACQQKSACAAAVQAPAAAPAPAPEPSVAARSLVRFLGGERAGVATATTPTTPTASAPSTGVQAGQGMVAAGAAQAGACETAAASVACQAAATQAAPAAELAARHQAERAHTNALRAEHEAQLSPDAAVGWAMETELAAQQAAERVYAELAGVQAGQARAGRELDEYTRSLERRIEALERRLAERDHVAPTPVAPPSVYHARPGSGAKIAPGAGGGAGYWESVETTQAPPSERHGLGDVEVIELEDLTEGRTEPGDVVVLSPDGRTRYPVSVAVPRAPVAPRAPRAPEPDAPSGYLVPGGMYAVGGGGGELAELTRLIEDMRAQVGELQRDLESLRLELSRVRASRNSGAR
jgi:hypothetical protein